MVCVYKITGTISTSAVCGPSRFWLSFFFCILQETEIISRLLIVQELLRELSHSHNHITYGYGSNILMYL